MILAVDPGKMTGWATLDLSTMTFASGESPFLDFLDHAWHWLQGQLGAHVVSERFIITGGTVRKSRGDVNWSIESIGALRFMVHTLSQSGHQFDLQNANDAKTFSPDARLKIIGWWHRGGGGHANDAARHMLLYVARKFPQQLPAGIIPAQ